MEQYIPVMENNPFHIDCNTCDNRDDLEKMTFTLDSKVLCSSCLVNYRVTNMLDHSKHLFLINRRKESSILNA